MSDQLDDQLINEDYRKQARQLRNRRSAQESRDRKRRYVELLEETNEQLRLENEDLKRRLERIEEDHISLTRKLFGPDGMHHRIVPGVYSTPHASPVLSISNTINSSGNAVMSHSGSAPVMLSPTHSRDAIGYTYNSENSFHTLSFSTSQNEEEVEGASDESAELVISKRSSSSFVGHPSGRRFDDPASATICAFRPKDVITPLNYPQQSDPSMILMGKLDTTTCICNRVNAKKQSNPSYPLQVQKLLVSFNLTPSLAIPIIVTIKNPTNPARLSLLLKIMQAHLVIYSRVMVCLHILTCLCYLWQRNQKL